MSNDERLDRLVGDEADQENRVLIADVPIDAVWLRLRQVGSVKLAEATLVERARRLGIGLDPSVARTKAEGLAYAVRNATDYYRLAQHNVSQRVLNLYYGTMAFAAAEMLASERGPATLAEIEQSTTQGHGLYTVSGEHDDLEGLVVGVIETGFFPAWMRVIGLLRDPLPRQKPKAYADLARLKIPADTSITIEQLFARIPELLDLFFDVFTGAPACVAVGFDMMERSNSSRFDAWGKKGPPPKGSVVELVDPTARLTVDALAAAPGPISNFEDVSAEPDPWRKRGRKFRATVAHAAGENWFDALRAYKSPLFGNMQHHLVFPIFREISEFRAIATVLLYALSIVVRYRPTLWRRVQEGDLDHVRVLVEAFLSVVERVLPQQFLERITNRTVHAKHPGSF